MVVPQILEEGYSYDGRGWTKTISNQVPAPNKPPVSTTTPKKTSTGTGTGTTDAEAEYRDIEKNTLEGDVNLKVAIPSLKAKQTISLKGFGKVISGLFMVTKVTHTFSASGGYVQVVSVARNGFGESLKAVGTAVPRLTPVTPDVQTKTYTVRAGDNLSSIARKYSTTWQKIYALNKKVIGSNPNIIRVGQVLTLP